MKGGQTNKQIHASTHFSTEFVHKRRRKQFFTLAFEHRLATGISVKTLLWPAAVAKQVSSLILVLKSRAKDPRLLLTMTTVKRLFVKTKMMIKMIKMIKMTTTIMTTMIVPSYMTWEGTRRCCLTRG